MTTSNQLTAAEALSRLEAGNNRFLSTVKDGEIDLHERREKLLAGQNPFAIVLGCSDSRAPAEIIFDQSLGDLFVIRVAGNIVAPSQIGSVEFAAEQFGTPLVVVLGHTHCGAISATVDQLKQPTEMRSPNLHSIVRRIQPAVQGLVDAHAGGDETELKAQCGRANIRASVNQLRNSSEILEARIAKGQLRIVGAEYSLETGRVDFFDKL